MLGGDTTEDALGLPTGGWLGEGDLARCRPPVPLPGTTWVSFPSADAACEV